MLPEWLCWPCVQRLAEVKWARLLRWLEWLCWSGSRKIRKNEMTYVTWVTMWTRCAKAKLFRWSKWSKLLLWLDCVCCTAMKNFKWCKIKLYDCAEAQQKPLIFFSTSPRSPARGAGLCGFANNFLCTNYRIKQKLISQKGN